VQKEILRNSNTKNIIVVNRSELPLADLINILRNHIDEIKQEKKRCTKFISFDYFEKAIEELHGTIIEHFKSVREIYQALQCAK
jgi:hypothetical protein